MLLGGAPRILAAEDETTLSEAMTSGDHFVLLRHAIAPGTGDPDHFVIGDCTTQRNLSDRGRQQAAAIGERLRKAGVTAAEVYSSQWCRCLETAELLNLGPVREQPLLNSFFRRFEREEAQTNGLRQWLAEKDLSAPLILVTHQVNITALTGIYPGSGELVIVKRDKGGKLSATLTIPTE
jgi:broad specificity phosphatase PhoE